MCEHLLNRLALKLALVQESFELRAVGLRELRQRIERGENLHGVALVDVKNQHGDFLVGRGLGPQVPVDDRCFYGWRKGAGHKFYGPNNVPDVWSIKKISPQKMVHLT